MTFAVTGNYFSALGVPAALGRPIGLIDDEPGAPGAVMLSDAFWRRRFGADPSIIGKTILLNGSPFTVVGVAPVSFTGTLAPGRPDLWIAWNSPAPGRPSTALMIGRLRNEMSPEQAQADLSTIAAQLSAEQGRTVRVSVYRARVLHPEAYIPVAAFSGFLMVIVVLVLTITCLNIATMLIARAAQPSRVVGLMTRQVLRWTAIGLGLGLAAAAGAAQLLNNLIYGIKPADPLAFACITLVLAGTAYAARRFRARRSRIRLIGWAC